MYYSQFCLLFNCATSWLMMWNFQIIMQFHSHLWWITSVIWSLSVNRIHQVFESWYLISHWLNTTLIPLHLLLLSPPSSGGGPALVRVPVQVLLSAPVEPPAYGPHGQQELPTKSCGTQGETPKLVWYRILLWSHLFSRHMHAVSCASLLNC